jgi:RND family efflux transporter MFP subunit
MDMKIKKSLWPTAIVAGIALAGCHGKAPQQQQGTADGPRSTPVTVAKVEAGDMEKTVPVTGNLTALQDVTLSAKAVGRVDMVAAREGEPVRRGELVVRLFSQDLDANVEQAQANVVSAQAKLRQAYVNYKIGLVNANQNVLQAKASLAQAQENYLKVKRGSRPQEILQAKGTVESAEATMKNAKVTLDRDKSLLAQGAIAQQELDQAQTTYDVDVAQYNNANQALALSEEGSRQEDIASAAAQVRQQETSLRNAMINRDQVALRKDDIIASQAAVTQAQAQLAYNQKQAQYNSITSPIDGIVAARSTEPGQMAGVGSSLMRIVNLRTVYYQPTVSETDIADIHVGQNVGVKTDALPGKVFQGKVTAIYPAAPTGERTFSLRVTVDNPEGILRPGMFARGAIVTAVHHNVPVVPASALVADAAGGGFQPNTSSDEDVSAGGLTPAEHVVVVGPDGKAVIRHVGVGIANMDKAEITSGLQPGENIVVVGQNGLHDGDRLAVINGSGHHGERVSQASPAGL